jgi:hypothetical protein
LPQPQARSRVVEARRARQDLPSARNGIQGDKELFKSTAVSTAESTDDMPGGPSSLKGKNGEVAWGTYHRLCFIHTTRPPALHHTPASPAPHALSHQHSSFPTANMCVHLGAAALLAALLLSAASVLCDIRAYSADLSGVSFESLLLQDGLRVAGRGARAGMGVDGFGWVHVS